MSKKPKIDTNEINDKLKKLESVKRKLKSEFIGIDHQIEQLLESVKVWYIFPQTLNKPLIINLWGITGTFKTSVIRRFAALLDMNNEFKEIDSRKIPANSLRNIIGTGSRIDDPNIKYPSVFLLDEFQNIRTISSKGDDTETSNELYELFSWLSDGKIKYTRSAYDFSRLMALIKNITTNRGGVIEDIQKVIQRRKEHSRPYGRSISSIINGEAESEEIIQRAKQEDTDKEPFASAFYDTHYGVLEEYYAFMYQNIVKFGNDIDGLFNYLILESGKISMDYTLDLSKCLIFVAGNVDEAFSGLTHNMDNEMLTPDQFYEISSQVNFNVIKESLLWRFKPEQVARLGTNHVIFPSFNTKMYTKFIEKLHQRTKDKFKEFGIKIEIDDSVTQFILTHAAIPSQGSRSVLSAHEYLVDSNIPEALAKSLLTKGKKFTIAIDANDNILIITNKDIIVKEITIIDKMVLENYPEPLNSVICTHEAGHTLAVIALMGMYPDIVKVRMSNTDIGGYVKYNNDPLPTKESMKLSLAVAMSGYAAEYLVHGPDKVSAGASSDILNATANASYMIKVLGFGDGMSASGFSMSRDALVLNDIDNLNQQVDDLISEAFTLACVVLTFYKKEHKILTEKLKKNIVLKNEDIKKLLKM